MKRSSKILGILMALIAIGMVISAASAVNLAGDFKNEDFAIKVASDTNFNDTVNISSGNMKLVVFENSGKDSSDANNIIYFKDTSADKKEIDGFIKNFENSADKVEESDKYIVLKNTQKSTDFDISNGMDSIFDFANGIISSDEGLSVSSDGNSVSFSKNGLEVSDVNGQNVSITSDGVSISGDESSGNESVNVSGHVNSNIEDSDYSLYLKNNDNTEVIVISGNNLDLLKAMAETVSFK